jgi:dCTP deaminase
MILSDASLRDRLARPTEARIIVEPLMDGAIGPHSIDVRLGRTLLVWTPTPGPDFEQGVFGQLGETDRGWHLEPGRFYLGSTLEYVRVPADLRCVLDGCSTEARRSLVIHQTGGSVDAGWRGYLTLEVTVTIPQWIRPGDRIGQLTFQALDKPADRPYAGRYQGDRFPTPPKGLP